jgi:hypothetical protein
MRLIFTLTCLIIFSNCTASPPLNLCIDSCRHKQSFILGDETWTQVQGIFTDQSTTDESERQQLASAILLIHRDIDKQIEHLHLNKQANESESFELSAKDLARNLNEYIALLQDRQLINRHFLRKTEQRSVFFITEYASSIQSHEHGDIFTLCISNDSNEENLIVPLEKWKHEYTLKNLSEKIQTQQQNNTPTSNWDEGFE